MGKKLGWGLLILLSLFTLLIVSRYLTLDPDGFFPEQKAVYIAHLTTVITHVIGSMVALALGPLLFWNRLRIKWPAVHRWLGRLYLFGVLFGGVAGLFMSTFAYGGAITRTGFAALGLLWLTTGWMAYMRIRQGNVREHRRWVIRNFALTLAGVMLRTQSPLLGAFLDFETAYRIVSWTAWVPNLLVAEWILRAQRPVVNRPVTEPAFLGQA